MDNGNDENPPTNGVGGGGGNGGEQNNSAPQPKHIPFPEVPNNSEILNELFIFLFVLFAAGMQFIHIYRTVWWRPESHINHTINLYLIDPYLVVFITLMLARRLLYSVLNKFLELSCNSKQFKLHRAIFKYGFVGVFSLILGACLRNISTKQSYLSGFLLLYPLIVYMPIFGFQIESFLRTSCEVEGSYLNGMPMHGCSSNPSTIRQEIDVLKNDFNNRFKQVIFTSVINAYYAGFVPCFFAQNFVYYDLTWSTQHTIFVWLGGFTMCMVCCFPAKYSDVLHRAALHLGQWARIDGRSNGYLPPAVWSKSIAWTQGSVIRYSGDLYKSVGPVTTAIPGNISHFRFFKLFNNPSIVYMFVSGLQTFLVVLQILLLCFAVEWHNILSLSFLNLTNLHTLFKAIRDYLITQKVYAAESSIYEKLNSHIN